MAGLRKGCCYSHVKRAYTRKSKYKKKGFIKAIPTSKVIRYIMGDQQTSYPARIDLVTKEAVQVRHNALEATRLVINRRLNELLGLNNYLFLLRAYPHHVLRENKMITGAGADRVQTGMQRAFGKAVGIACQLRKNQPLFTVYCAKEDALKAKQALMSARPRMPGHYTVQIVERLATVAPQPQQNTE